MLVLCCVAGADWVCQGRVGLDNTIVSQHFQWHKVLRVKLFKPLACKSKGSKVFINNLQQIGGSFVPEYRVRCTEHPHIVTHVCGVIVDDAFSGRTESFDGILLAFNHFRLIISLYDRHTLACVNLVG